MRLGHQLHRGRAGSTQFVGQIPVPLRTMKVLQSGKQRIREIWIVPGRNAQTVMVVTQQSQVVCRRNVMMQMVLDDDLQRDRQQKCPGASDQHRKTTF
jgi:hypothetical protein